MFIFLFSALIPASFVVANSTVHCNSEQYIVKDKGKPDRCQNCGDCHPGYSREPTCGTVLLHPPQTTCEPCKRGTFSDAEDSSPCKTCHLCAPLELVKKKCTNTSNTICNNKCAKGYYFENASHDCQACSYCCGDGKDKIIKECAKQGMPRNRQCTIHRAQQCNPPTSDRTPTGQPAAPTSNAKPPVGTIVGCIVGGIVGITLFFIWCLMYRKRKSRRQSAGNIELGQERVVLPPSQTFPDNIQVYPQDREQNGNADGQALQITGRDESKQIPKASPRMNGVKNPNYAPSPGVTPKGTPSNTDDELDEGPAKGDAVKKQSSTGDQGARSRKNSKGLQVLEKQNSTDSTGDQARSRKNSRGQAALEKQNSTDSTGEQEKIPRKSRKLSRKQSVDTQTLLEEKLEPSGDELEAPIRIIKPPRPQTITEGETLKLDCEASGPPSICYQWLKNGEKLSGETIPTFVTQSVKMAHFGYYSCCVGSIETKAAFVDVQPEQGTRYKFLCEVNMNIRGDIADMLNSKRKSRLGLGGWKEIAVEYSMKENTIESLENLDNPTEDVLAYLGASRPRLTVYDFCKTLIHQKIKRNDVVEVLLPHLSCKDDEML